MRHAPNPEHSYPPLPYKERIRLICISAHAVEILYSMFVVVIDSIGDDDVMWSTADHHTAAGGMAGGAHLSVVP